MPFVLQGKAKKVVALTSGHADPRLINDFGIRGGGPYAITKGALNITIAKYNATYAPQGVTFMAVCPSAVAQDKDPSKLRPRRNRVERRADPKNPEPEDLPERDAAGMMEIGGQFMKYAPGFKGGVPPSLPVSNILSLMERANVADGYGGAFISHNGTQQWLPLF